MTRPTRLEIDTSALVHNAQRVKEFAPGKQIIAMVKADAYGCGTKNVIPALSAEVDAFGVACIEEATVVRRYTDKPCILFQGIFTQDELANLAENRFEPVVHQEKQLEWILNASLAVPIRVWVKVDTGMHRLGFLPQDVHRVVSALQASKAVQNNIGLISHFASADERDNPQNEAQMEVFHALDLPHGEYTKSTANSAAILSRPNELADVVRPGIMLYGVSPFATQNGEAFKLKPVMHFISEITAVHDYPKGAKVGYGGTWTAQHPSRIGVVAVGYGDGYPRHINPNTCVYIEGQRVPIVGRVSMDTLTVDLTQHEHIHIGSKVELWGEHIPVEEVARHAGTIGYELMCQVSPRVRIKSVQV